MSHPRVLWCDNHVLALAKPAGMPWGQQPISSTDGSAYYGEIGAFGMLGEFLERNKEKIGEEIWILSDCMSAIYSFSSANPKSPTTDKMQKKCEFFRHKIRLEWVPAHCYIPHEMADEMATRW